MSVTIRLRGFSLVEVLIVLAIIAVLATLGMRSYAEWMANSQVRVSAESIQAAVQLARAEALKRNSDVRFQVVTSTDNTCELAPAGSSWVVSQGDPSGSCANANMIRVGGVAEGAPDAIFMLADDVTTLTFNGLGMLKPAVGVTIDVANSQGQCLNSGGNVRCLRLQINSGGQVRMCDPHATDEVRKC